MSIRDKGPEYSREDYRRESSEDLRSFREKLSVSLGLLFGGAFSLVPAVVEIVVGAGVAILIGFLIPGGG